MQPQLTPAVLLYNFQEDSRTAQIRRFLQQSGISIRQVPAPDYLQPIGALFGLPSIPRSQLFHMGSSFTEEMLVMKDFTSGQIDALLQFIRSAGLARIELKAVLTPYNQHWNSLQLYQELCKERAAMRR